MMSKDTGGPAFPGLHPSAECHYKDEGMTLRDYFAAKAMQGLLQTAEGEERYCFEQLALFSYEMADAVLKARNT